MFLTFPRKAKSSFLTYSDLVNNNVYISDSILANLEIFKEYLIGKVYDISQSMDRNKLIGSEGR